MLRRVIEVDQLPEYAMELAETTVRSHAVQFRRWGEAEAMALAEKMRVEERRRAGYQADRLHTDEVDAHMDRLSRR